MKTMKLHHKNLRTGEHEVITQQNVELVDWGFNFLVNTESEAYKAAYLYRQSPHVKIEYCPNLFRYMITVFNEGFEHLWR